jgi:hypothetical protein
VLDKAITLSSVGGGECIFQYERTSLFCFFTLGFSPSIWSTGFKGIMDSGAAVGG